MSTALPARDDWFVEQHAFPRPAWAAINGWLRAFASREELDSLWQQITRQWLERLRNRLGGDYAVEESKNFHLLSERPATGRTRTLAFCEAARARIRRIVGDIGPQEVYGKHVILHFADYDDYCAYAAHFGPDGEQATSAGVFLRDGYDHVAIAESWSLEETNRILVHELTHNLLVGLPLPMWLNEALAMAFEKDLAGSASEPLNRELAGRHREYWTPDTIQQFWRGDSFGQIDAQELSYSLSRILLELIHTDLQPTPEEFRRFVLRSDWSDAGAVASHEHLGIALRELVAGFLGPGDWQPRQDLWLAENDHAADQERA